jgi:hypothetical protein
MAMEDETTQPPSKRLRCDTRAPGTPCEDASPAAAAAEQKRRRTFHHNNEDRGHLSATTGPRYHEKPPEGWLNGGAQRCATTGPARDSVTWTPAVYPGSGPSTPEVTPLLPALFLILGTLWLQCSSSCSV